jgi:DNA invertase Pin-like site-specific DNA recombinase
MPRGHTTRLQVCLTPEERRTLEAWQRTTTLPAGQVRRGRIILLLEDGRTITQIAHAVGISRRFVYKWVRRFQAQGLAGLEDLPRPGPWHTRRRAPR